MTFPFKEEIVNDSEYSKYNFEHPLFIGYLNKYGQVLDYSSPLGIGGHTDNKLTTYFEYYFRMPTHDSWLQQSEGIDVINLESEQYYVQNGIEYFKEEVEIRANKSKKYGSSNDVDSRFMNDLNLFFFNCYQADTFMDGFGQNCMCLNQSEFYQRYCEGKELYQRQPNETEKEYHEREKNSVEYDYHWYKKNLMLDWYKIVIVQYMHYHLIERCGKGITTSDLRPNETFYNYLLNDFTIQQIPRMMYDNTKKMYIPYKQNQFLMSDSELRLQEEIQAIKKLIPIKERVQYYR